MIIDRDITGKYFVTRAGHVVGPMIKSGHNEFWPYYVEDERSKDTRSKTIHYRTDGSCCAGKASAPMPDFDLSHEYSNPITTKIVETATIKPGCYGVVIIFPYEENGKIGLDIPPSVTAMELRSMAHLFNDLANFLDGENKK